MPDNDKVLDLKHGPPLFITNRPSSGSGTGLSWLVVHIYPPASFILAEVGNYIYIMHDNDTWEKYPYDALSEFHVQYGEPIRLVGLEATRYILARMGVACIDTTD